MALQLLGGVLLVCLGLLLGATWTIQALQPKLRQQATERRSLNEQWSVIRYVRPPAGEVSALWQSAHRTGLVLRTDVGGGRRGRRGGHVRC
jgi:hypothetical protein